MTTRLYQLAKMMEAIYCIHDNDCIVLFFLFNKSSKQLPQQTIKELISQSCSCKRGHPVT